ncbi:nitrilase-related carbon-nitrogen hydrolase [Microbispora sp. NPDC049125]|uniref:nitrilase-related carbon-nitrogen hydrolase n=1 Tax=Microbispora sp. NPDC049125 TaxID=3154929 RepID=UPI00346546DE
MTRVAVAQLSLQVARAAGNRAAAEAAVEEAAAAGARVVVLPELVNSGYVFSGAGEAEALAEPADGPTVTGWARLARAHDLVIVGGFCERVDGGVSNSQALVDPAGIREVYRKVHLWDDEQDVFVPGERAAPVVDTAVGRIGMMVCYDLEFPEWVRACALAGADLLAVSTNWPSAPVPIGERPVLVAYAQVAAAGNRMFVAVADRCGAERGVSWVSGTSIIGPDGYPLAGPVLQDRPAVLVADCDLTRAWDKSTGSRNDVHRDRRPHLYGGGDGSTPGVETNPAAEPVIKPVARPAV